jgi:hypothetical protein
MMLVTPRTLSDFERQCFLLINIISHALYRGMGNSNMPLHSNCLHGIAIARHAGNFEVDIASAPPSLNGNIAPSNVLATNADFILYASFLICRFFRS